MIFARAKAPPVKKAQTLAAVIPLDALDTIIVGLNSEDWVTRQMALGRLHSLRQDHRVLIDKEPAPCPARSAR